MHHIHILGISGTFMSGLAIIAKESGYKVTGCDKGCYPPVSDLLQDKGIDWVEGYEVNKHFLAADEIIVGNAMKRGMPIVEALLDSKKAYTSGPEWLYKNILVKKRVIAVSGTHGKTTTTCMIATILEKAGFAPGFLIGGVAPFFNTNARVGQKEWFVIEADEYDSAFFDKRPKFMHYHPEIATLNNLEFDHADIYPDLASIEQQFHYYLRTLSSKAVIIKPENDEALNRVLKNGCYSKLEELAVYPKDTKNPAAKSQWQAILQDASGSLFTVLHRGKELLKLSWPLIGQFNVENALTALVAAYHAGVNPSIAEEALQQFQPVKRRLELRAKINEIAVYDDFAHHPSAIAKTIEALRSSGRHKRILVALEFASYTMRTFVHAKVMEKSLALANKIYLLESPGFDVHKLINDWRSSVTVVASTANMINSLLADVAPGDAILIMSNRGFDGLHTRLIAAIAKRV
ncbi:MAG: UDP-N-acetylmuramate:L-alanyl-gamma-D-glutamyl-meso-diaminopimelate ligase [Legionellales bacterium RIFCSPHIGHO2_12_FULL_37_14]|nr:MAG: UDP-N-acetylmuramate:L-alanyl-gamma-D-glutamyl-meso-diaminopimelate ligase [Legionellales bacterium RIFCSPHIGHO2_12_FULL_37_14]